MLQSRRRLLMTFASAAGALAVEPLLPGLKQAGHDIKPHPYPNGRDPNAPVGTDEPSRPDPKAIREENQKEIKLRVAKLCDMVLDLREQVERTDANSTLSLSLVKKAQQIEKLAKQIKELAKG